MKRLTISCLLILGRAALAQPIGGAQPTPPDTATPPVAETVPVVAAPTSPSPMAPQHEPMIRIRAGVDGAPAIFVPGISYGANFSGRIGVQIKNRWGAYLDVGGGFGLGGSISGGTGGGGVSIDVASYWRLMFMGEADIGRLFFVSFGPGVCGCTWGAVQQVATTMGASQAAYISGGNDAALMARVGLGFGQGRNRFTLALENMLVFGKMTQVSQNASTAGADQSVKIGNVTLGWAPALVFGWDMR